MNADGPHRVLSLLSLWRLDTDHSQSSSSTNARTTSDATTRTSSRFKTYPHIHLHPRSRPTHRLRAHTPRHPPARARPKNPTPHIARARHRLAPPSRARSRRRTSTVETHPHPLARAIALVPFARTMTFVLVRQEKADRARGDSRTTTTTAPEAGRVGRIRTRTTTRHETPSSRAPDRVGSVVVPLVLDPFLMASRDRITRNRIPREIEGVNFFFLRASRRGYKRFSGVIEVCEPKNTPHPLPPIEGCRTFGHDARADVANPPREFPGKREGGVNRPVVIEETPPTEKRNSVEGTEKKEDGSAGDVIPTRSAHSRSHTTDARQRSRKHTTQSS